VAVLAARFHYHRALAVEYPVASRDGAQPAPAASDSALA
jgi:hypothetical protein